jgi:hypothetical protein
MSRYKYGPEGGSSIRSREKNICLFSTGSRPFLLPTVLPIQRVSGVKLREDSADHSPPSSAEEKNNETVLRLHTFS